MWTTLSLGLFGRILGLSGGRTGGSEEIPGKARYSEAKKNIISKLNDKQLKKHIPMTL
jgi:hypothetical protein